MRLPSTPLLSLLSTTLLLACGGDAEPPPPTDVRAALRNDLTRVLTESQAAMEATANLPSGSAFGFATIALGGADGSSARAIAPLTRLLAPRDRNLSLDEEGGTTIDTQAIVDQLEQELFTDENYLGNGVYRVPASLVCTETTYDETTGEPITGINPECAQRLTQAQLRVRVAGTSSAMRFFIQVTANHDEPLAFYLANDELAITLDLDEAIDAMITLATLFGEQAPNAALSGAITGSVKVLGSAHARMSLSFDRALSVKFADQAQSLDGPDAFRFSSAAGEIIGVELDANAPKGSFDLGLGETRIHIPGDPLDPQPTEIALGGATVTATFQGDTLTLANLSLGTSTTTVSVGGQQAVAIDLNPNDGRALTATISADPVTGTETLAVSPRLDLQQTVDHAVLGDEPPVYDVTRVQLDGSLRGSALGDQVEVLTGSLAVTTNPAQYGFSAAAGQCVQATDVWDDATFTSYTQYSVGPCP